MTHFLPKSNQSMTLGADDIRIFSSTTEISEKAKEQAL
jgi:hypothetical protein